MGCCGCFINVLISKPDPSLNSIETTELALRWSPGFTFWMLCTLAVATTA
jgi:hypothetical protein